MLEVRFSNFWPGFTARESLFHSCLQKITNGSVVIVFDPDKKVDLEIESVYPSVTNWERLRDRIKLNRNVLSYDAYAEKYRFRYRSDYKMARKRVWYTAENLRAPHGVYDLTIGFDPTDELFRNIYFPFWMYRIDWGMGNKLSEIAPSSSELIRARIAVDLNRSPSVCMFSSTKDPNRLRLMAAIERAIPVDCFGSAFGNYAES